MTKSSKTKNLNKLIDHIQKEIGKQNAFYMNHIFSNNINILRIVLKKIHYLLLNI